MYKKTLSKGVLQKHFAKISKNHPYWSSLGSQTRQEVIERYCLSRERFFKKKGKHPKTKKFCNFHSFCFKQNTGYRINGNHLCINGVAVYGFWLHREIEGNIKRISLQRKPSGNWYLCVFTDKSIKTDRGQRCNATPAGLDFGLKTYITDSDGNCYKSPQFFKQNMKRLQKAHQNVSQKVKGSRRRKLALKMLNRVYEKTSAQRADFQWKLANELCRRHNFISIETLNIKAMQRMWGRKISDLAHAEFVAKLKYVATRYGTEIVEIDKWYPSSKLCFDCGYKNVGLKLADREWVCPQCGTHHDRDINAAKNIKREGYSSRGTVTVSPSQSHDCAAVAILKPEAARSSAATV
jgi:putative transposase